MGVNQDAITGKYGNFDTQQQAESHVSNQSSQGFGDGVAGDAGTAIGKAVGTVGVGILMTIPYIIGGAIGGFIALLMKMGVVGRILLTISAFCLVWFLLSAIMAFGLTSFGIEGGTLSVKLLFLSGSIPALLTAVWFWRSHYQALLKISGTDLVVMAIKFCKTIFSWLLVVAFIHLCVFIISLGAIQKFRILNHFAWFYTFPFLLAVYNWFKAIYGWGLFTGAPVSTITREPMPDYILTNAQPSDSPAAENRCATGDLVWALHDDEYYFAKIDDAVGDKVKVTYCDKEETEVNSEDIYYFDELLQHSDFKPYHFERKSEVWSCVIDKKLMREVTIRYGENNTVEKVPYRKIKFRNLKSFVKKPQSEYVGAEPTACPASGNRFAKGDCVWAYKKSMEYYYGVIDDASGEKVEVTFFDGKKLQVKRKNIYYYTEIKAERTPYAYRVKDKNWNECAIVESRTNIVLIRYKEDSYEAIIPYHDLMFI